jgi:acyl dehydratase
VLDLAVGTTGTPFDMVVESGKVWEFALATNAGSPPVQVDVPPPVPPTFLISSAFWYQPGSWVLEKADVDWARLLSGGSEFTFYGTPIRVGQRLTGLQRVEDAYTKTGRRGGTMRFLVFVTDYHRQNGTLAAQERHTTIETDSSPERPVQPAGASVEAVEEGPKPTGPPSLSTGPLAAGDSLPTFVDEPVTRNRIVRYQAASGDFNPVHHDELYAQAAGFPTVFSVGMFHAGLLAGHLAHLFGAERVRRFGVQFREQMWPGDVLTYTGTVRAARQGDGGGELDLDLNASRHLGGTAVRGWATVDTPPAPAGTA